MVDAPLPETERALAASQALAAWFDTAPEAARGVVWAHDSHMIEDLPEIAEMSGFVTVGTVLREKLGEDYASVGFSWSQGAFRATRMTEGGNLMMALQSQTFEPFNLPNNRPGDLGNVSDRTDHKALWMDLAALPAGRARGQLGRPALLARLVRLDRKSRDLAGDQSRHGRVFGAGARGTRRDRLVPDHQPLAPVACAAIGWSRPPMRRTHARATRAY
nr:erythromycin esterase family protein [Erythrobacter tepidarius]